MTMLPSEAALILTKMATFDQRTVGETDARAWADVLTKREVGVQEALEGVSEHYAATSERLMPARLAEVVKRMRRDRINAGGPPDYPSDLSIAQERRWLRTWQNRLVLGDGTEEAKGVADEAVIGRRRVELPFRPGDIDELREQHNWPKSVTR